jgi:hypothetical protein
VFYWIVLVNDAQASFSLTSSFESTADSSQEGTQTFSTNIMLDFVLRRSMNSPIRTGRAPITTSRKDLA